MPHAASYWTDCRPTCWTLSRKPFWLLRVTADEMGVPVIKYPDLKKYSDGFSSTPGELFGDKRRSGHMRHFPKAGDKYFLGMTVKGGPKGMGSDDSAHHKDQNGTMLVRSELIVPSSQCQISSVAGIYLLNGADVNHRLAIDYDPTTKWYKENIEPRFFREGGVWLTSLQKIINGTVQEVKEIADPKMVRVFVSRSACKTNDRVVVTRDDRPYFVMQANGDTIKVSEPARNLLNPAKAKAEIIQLALAS